MSKSSDRPIARLRPANLTIPEALSLSELTLNVLKIAGTVGPILLAFLGVVTSIGGGIAGFAVSFDEAALPIRLAIFIAITAALGGSLATLIDWLTANHKEAGLLGSHLLAVLWATLLIGSARWLAGGPDASSVALQDLFAVIGLAIAFVLLRFRFRASVGYTGPRRLRALSQIIFSFAATALLVMVVLPLLAEP